MDLFEMANSIEENGLSCIDELFTLDKKEEDKPIDLFLIPPNNQKWIKFNNNDERKQSLKNYKSLGKRDTFYYKSKDNKVECSIVGYLDIPKDVDHDHLVIEINNKLHVIATDYFLDMQ